MKDITENMVSMTQSISLLIETRDSFQELQTTPVQTPTVLRPELVLDDRDPSQVIPTERVRIL